MGLAGVHAYALLLTFCGIGMSCFRLKRERYRSKREKICTLYCKIWSCVLFVDSNPILSGENGSGEEK